MSACGKGKQLQGRALGCQCHHPGNEISPSNFCNKVVCSTEMLRATRYMGSFERFYVFCLARRIINGRDVMVAEF